MTAVAHKLSRLVYKMMTFGMQYVDVGQDHYEQQYRQRVIRNLKRRAKQLGYELTPVTQPTLQQSP